MNEIEWMDAESACAVLCVRAQTLYAYVSRHQIRVKADPQDSRKSLYASRDVEAVSRQKRRPRARTDVARAAIRWGDPVLETSISEVRDGTIWFRGVSVTHCADTMSLEQVAALLCGIQSIEFPQTRMQVKGKTPFVRVMKALASATETARPMQNRKVRDVAPEARRMVALVADACLGHSREGPIHERIGNAWGLKKEAQGVLRRALVLLSDHELNPSTFAVRVCASTGASLPAALLSGMATLSGPKHGGVATLANEALAAELEGRSEQFLTKNTGRDTYTYGFGHPLYPDGDPRASYLLQHIPNKSLAKLAVLQLSKRVQQPANIDAALAAFVAHFDCPKDAAATIYSASRVVGWIAHALEQVQRDTLIRPRAEFRSTHGPNGSIG